MGDIDTKKRPLESTVRSSPRLLLHCVDGCVPYLNPNQLEEHFPPSDNSDLWLGLAVRDACVMPVYQSPNEKKNKKKEKSRKETAHKIRGYTFCPTPPDPWLLPYTRFTVPAFDLSDGEKTKNAGASKSTNNALHVWTPHGRQKLTTDLYAKASLEGLQSHHTVSMFDQFDEEDFSARRKRKALERNEEWFQHLAEAAKESSTTAKAEKLPWKPILLPHSVEDSKDDEDENTNAMRPKIDADKETIVPSGFAFVGRWRSDLQLNSLLGDTTLFDKVPFKAILTTHSLSEILEIASAGVANIIGTNLPQKWAKEKFALGIDLLSLESGETNKRQKTEESADEVVLNQDGCMDLSDKRYARDPRPLVPGCDSFVCLDNRFSRAYIHHLVVAKEMVAEILLFGHNLHCLLKLIRCFDGDESQREKVKDAILQQITASENK